jgi:hypothetical protein
MLSQSQWIPNSIFTVGDYGHFDEARSMGRRLKRGTPETSCKGASYGSASSLLGIDCVGHVGIQTNAGMFGVVIVWCGVVWRGNGNPVFEWHNFGIFNPISLYALRKSVCR